MLAVGLTPPADAENLSRVMKVRLNDDGFCQTVCSHQSRPPDPEYSSAGVLVTEGYPDDRRGGEWCRGQGGHRDSSASRNTLVTKKEYPKEIDVVGKEPRVGVFIQLGINIGGVVNVPEVMEYAKTLPNVVYADRTCTHVPLMLREGPKEKVKDTT